MTPSDKLDVFASAHYASLIAGRIRDSMASGILPWSRPARLGCNCGLPKDEEGRPITGVARWLLELAAIERGYTGSLWASDGATEGVEVVLGESVKGQAWKDYRAVTLYPAAAAVELRPPDYDEAQRIVDATGARVRSGPNPLYVRREDGFDFVLMPPKEYCSSLDEWWWLMFHELGHWACYGLDRLAWEGELDHGEMIADMAAAILVDRCGIPAAKKEPGPNHRAWLYNMKKSSAYVYEATEVAERAADYILKLARGRHGDRRRGR